MNHRHLNSSESYSSAAVALYAHHRVSVDHGHTPGDLRERFDDVLAQLCPACESSVCIHRVTGFYHNLS